MKRAGRFAGWVVAIAAATVGGFLLYLSSPPGEASLKRLAAEKAGDALGAVVAIDRLETNILNRVEVEGVTVEPESPSSGVPSMRIERARIRYGIFALLFSGIQFDSVFVSGASIAFRHDSTRPPPAPHATSDTAATAFLDENGRFVPPLRLGFAELSEVRVIYDDQTIPIRLSASGIGIGVRLDEESGGDFRLGADTARLEYFDSPVGLSGLLVSGSVNRADNGSVVPLEVDTFRAVLNGMRMEGSGELYLDGVVGAQGRRPIDARLAFDFRPVMDRPDAPVGDDSTDTYPAGERQPPVDAQPPHEKRPRFDGRLLLDGDPRPLFSAISSGLGEEMGPGTISADAAFTIEDPFSAPVARVSLIVPSVTVAGVPASNVRFDGALHGDTLTVVRFLMGVYGGAVTGRGWISLDSLNHNVHLAAKGVRVSDFWKSRTKPGKYTRIPVALDATVDSRGPLSAPLDLVADARLTVSSRNTLIAAPQVKYGGRRLSVTSEKGMAHFEADLDIDAKGCDGTIDLSVPSIGEFSNLTDVGGLDGTLEARAALDSRGTKLLIEGTATSDGISWRGVDVADDVYAAVSVQGDRVVVDTGHVAGWGVDLAELLAVVATGGGGGSGEAAGSDSAAGGDNAARRAEAGSGSLSGTLAYELTLHGPIGNPTASIAASIDDPRYGSLVFDRADFDLALADSVLEITDAVLQKDSTTATALGMVDLRTRAGNLVLAFRNGAAGNDISDADSLGARFSYKDTANFSLDAAAHRLNVSTLRAFLPIIGIDGGRIAFSANVVSEEGRLRADFPFALTGVTIRKGTIDSVSGAFRYHDGVIDIDSVSASNEGRRFFADAVLELRPAPGGGWEFGWDCPTRGVLTGDTLELARIIPFLAKPVEIGGAVNVDLRWDGVVRRPRVQGTIALSSIRYGAVPKAPWFTALEGTLRLGEGALRSDSLNAKIGKVPVVLVVALNREDSGGVNGSFHLSADSVLLLGAKAAFTGDSIDLLIASDSLDLAVVQPFAEGLKKLKGRLTTRLSVRGAVADPLVDGRLEVGGVSFEPGTSGVALTEGAVSARLTGERLIIDSVRGVVGSGRIFASGEGMIDSGGLKGFTASLTASGIKVTKKGVYQVNVKSTELKLAPAKERYLLSGMVEFGETKFVRDIEIGEIVDMMSDETVTDPLAEPKKPEPLDLLGSVTKDPEFQEALPDVLKQVDFDIEIRNAEGLWVDNNLASFRSLHDLRLQGNLEQASLTGRIDVRDRGELIFLDRRFEILNGVIDCSDPHRLNPVINLTAQTTITETPGGNQRPTRYTITLTVSGPLDEFEYELTSKPSLERADIISLIALGMTQYALESGGDKDAVYKDRSEVVASQQISNSVNRFFDNWLGDFLALDHIGIGGNLFDPSQTRFEVTKRWSDRVEISYSTSLTSSDEQILSAEYRINDWLYLEGKTDQQEDSGADIKFRIWFK